LVLVGKIGYMNFLGKAMWCFIACNYINPIFGYLGVIHSLLLTHFVPHSFLLIPDSFLFILGLGLGMGNELWEEKSHYLLVVSNS
jgi:hypothetical protein